MSFLGTQPRRTQVPPAPPLLLEATRSNGISQTATFAPVRHHWVSAVVFLRSAAFVYMCSMRLNGKWLIKTVL